MSRGTAFPTRFHLRSVKTQIRLNLKPAKTEMNLRIAKQNIRYPPEDSLDP